MTDIRIAVMGAAGRMGRELVRAVYNTSGCQVAGGAEMPGSSSLGADVGELAGIGRLDLPITADTAALFSNCDAVIDFTSPAATANFAKLAAGARIIHVIGTTGLGDEHEAAIREASCQTAIVKAGNMSLGVNLLSVITAKIAQALDEDFDIEILEMHHKRKVDAPSGTALMLGEAAARGRGIDLKSRSVRARDGHTGVRQRGDIGFATLRGGDVVGDHTVIFAADGERIEITHRASDRSIFARGAVKAALWAQGKQPGLYAMTDVLGF